MKKICIVGSGPGGAVVALELAKSPDFEVILVDCDRLAASFDKDFRLAKDESSYLSFQTVGYGFGGTSNLWHGVLTRLDDEDLSAIEDVSAVGMKDDLIDRARQASRYFGNLAHLDSGNDSADHPLSRYLRLDELKPKPYFVQPFALRFRKLLRRGARRHRNLRLVEGAVAIKVLHDGDRIESLEYWQEGRICRVTADVFVVSAGALETPRILMQSFEGSVHANPLVGAGLMDHPVAILGELVIPKRVLYKQHGVSSPLRSTPNRIGYTIPRAQRHTAANNHSLFIRPHADQNIAAFRNSVKRLVYRSSKAEGVRASLMTKSSVSALVFLLLEKFGFGYYTNRFLVSMQLEQPWDRQSRVTLSQDVDAYGRRVPSITYQFQQQLLDDVSHTQVLLKGLLKAGAEFAENEVGLGDLDPGSHHSGTCKLGPDRDNSVVGPDLRVHGLRNLYVCDASVLPKIGNANLTLTITSFALRLASHLAAKSDAC